MNTKNQRQQQIRKSKSVEMLKSLPLQNTNNVWDVIDQYPEMRTKLLENKPKKPATKKNKDFDSLIKTHQALDSVLERKEALDRVLLELRPVMPKKGMKKSKNIKVPNVQSKKSLEKRSPSPLCFTKSFQDLFTKLQATTGLAEIQSKRKVEEIVPIRPDPSELVPPLSPNWSPLPPSGTMHINEISIFPAAVNTTIPIAPQQSQEPPRAIVSQILNTNELVNAQHRTSSNSKLKGPQYTFPTDFFSVPHTSERPSISTQTCADIKKDDIVQNPTSIVSRESKCFASESIRESLHENIDTNVQFSPLAVEKEPPKSNEFAEDDKTVESLVNRVFVEEFTEKDCIDDFVKNLHRAPRLIRQFVTIIPSNQPEALPIRSQGEILHYGAKLEAKILDLMRMYNTFIEQLGSLN
jgi:hypothetical protein